VVPDVAEEYARVRQVRDRGRQVIGAWLDREQHALAQRRQRPALAAPFTAIDDRESALRDTLDRARRCLRHHLDRADDDTAHRLARVRALSPLATLERGYAVVQTADGDVVRAADQVAPGDAVAATMAQGRLDLRVEDTQTDPP
jgi:exodeoxyribonuclease VII large subunit